MSSIIVPRSLARKPVSPVASLSQHLPSGSVVHLLNNSHAASGYYGFPGVPVSGSNPTSRGLECSGDDWYDVGQTDSFIATSFHQRIPITVVLVCYPEGIGTDNARFATGNSLGSSLKGWFLGYENRSVVSSPNRMRFFCADGTGAQADYYIGPTLRSGQRVVAVVKTTDAEVVGYVNGFQSKQTWLRSASTGNTTFRVQVGKANHSSTVLPFVGLIESVAFIPASMSDAWCYQASLSPYQMLLAPSWNRVFAEAAAAGAPSITALSAINITATSAQPRISYS